MDKKKILVVDDEPDFLSLIKIRLEANNYKVITALDGASALEKIKNESPTAVLLDIQMPVMDGLEVLKRIRQVDSSLPVFMLTAFSNDVRFKLANKLNASGFIIKTSDLKEEVERIDSVLRLSDKFKSA
ncbi:MAG: response regulator [Candidatus Omnitrophica bacterium]|nr:response regulator [Candidatus Omnitrophota bacterium]